MIKSKLPLQGGHMEIEWSIHEVNLGDRIDYAPVVNNFSLYLHTRRGEKNITKDMEVHTHQAYYNLCERFVASHMHKHLSEVTRG